MLHPETDDMYVLPMAPATHLPMARRLKKNKAGGGKNETVRKAKKK